MRRNTRIREKDAGIACPRRIGTKSRRSRKRRTIPDDAITGTGNQSGFITRGKTDENRLQGDKTDAQRSRRMTATSDRFFEKARI
jgi:hypothetical protein